MRKSRSQPMSAPHVVAFVDPATALSLPSSFRVVILPAAVSFPCPLGPCWGCLHAQCVTSLKVTTLPGGSPGVRYQRGSHAGSVIIARRIFAQGRTPLFVPVWPGPCVGSS